MKNIEIVSCFAFSSDAEMIASGDNFLIKIWNTHTGDLLRMINSDNTLDSLCFSPDNQIIISVRDSEIKFWDITTGNLIRVMIVPELPTSRLESVSVIASSGFVYDDFSKRLMNEYI